MKKIEFTEAQKSLIANEFVAPANGSPKDAIRFVEYCEELGLNPILNDVVFQRHETKKGPRCVFVTTRDGLLRVAANDPNYMGPPISSVVREGDHFEFLPAQGNVNHVFGQKRGKIMGAYAVLHHKKFGTAAQWVEFDEYFLANANSQRGNSYIWDSYPSAMIQKVAESIVLKRLFPLGGMTTEEETGQEINLPEQMDGIPTEKPETVNLPANEETPVAEINQSSDNTSVNQKDTQEKFQNEAKNLNEKETAPDKPVQQNEEPENQPVEQSDDANRETDNDEFVLVKVLNIQFGESPSNIKFASIELLSQGKNKKFRGLARDAALEQAQHLKQGSVVEMKIIESNGFYMIQEVRKAINA